MSKITALLECDFVYLLENMKNCKLCGLEVDCRGLKCRSCMLGERRSRMGVVSVMYNSWVARSKKRGYPAIEYSKAELYEWLLSQGFEALYERWVASGHEPLLKPSCERLSEGYGLSGLRLTTVGDAEIKNRGAVKRVYCYNFKGEYVKRYESIAIAAREMGCVPQTISNLCKRGKDYRWGFFWRFT